MDGSADQPRNSIRPPHLRMGRMLPYRAALGLSAARTPSLLFVLAGIVLGPHVANIVSAGLLARLDPVISLALGILGIFIGAGYFATPARAESGRWVLGASLQAFITISTVLAAMYFLLGQWRLPVDPFTIAALLALCTAVSASAQVHGSASRESVAAAHFADLDDLAVLVLAAIAVPLSADPASFAVSLTLALVAALGIAVAGSVLFAHSRNHPERDVFVVGTVMLLAGVGAYSNVSPLATGCIAGLWWNGVRRTPAPLIEAELSKLQHPLVALLLVIAGASIDFSFMLLWVAAPLVLVRFSGKLLASMVLAKWLRLEPGLVVTVLVPPGFVGIALALNFQQVLGTGGTLVLSAVTLTTVASELLAAFLSDPEPAA